MHGIHLYLISEESIGSSVGSDNEDLSSDDLRAPPSLFVYDPTIDTQLPDTVSVLTTPEGAEVYVVGTAHFSVESQEDVAKVSSIR
jgi:hypothetical protein